jgi:hypothetical protein
MRYAKAIALVIAIAALLVVTRTAMQQSGEKQLPGNDPVQQVPAVDTMRSGDIGPGIRHKFIINQGDEDIYAEFAKQGAIAQEIDYGSFRLIVVDETRAQGGRVALTASRVPVRDDQNLIGLNGYILDTMNPAATYDRLPAELRQGDMAEALARGGSPQGGLYLVQFAGPIKDDWLDDLRASGMRIVSYVPNNAYVVQGDAVAAANLTAMRNRGFVQFLGDYEPGFRISPTLQRAYASGGDAQLDVTVQVINNRSASHAIEQLRGLATQFVQEHAVLDYRNVELRIPVSQIGVIAGMSDVFAIEERVPRQRLDEAQGQIVAGNLTGNSPSGPGYLTWLAGKGFNSTQFGTFAVNVVDDATSLTGHPDFAAGRIAFTNNPTAQAGAQGGHGFLNSNIIGGFNNGTGSANEDANGFNYGLGIAPFARVGITAIFGNGASTPTAWESTAYGQGARISSNSWGFQSLFRYDANAQEYDRIVRDAQTAAGNQQLAVVFAAGNDGSGANTVSSPGTAKNVITVGASENVRQTGTDGCAVANSGADSANDIINFSSRGPVNSAGGDGRIKPEIVAPGTHIEAGIPQSNYDGSSVCNKFFPAGQTLYGWSSGTSHSCPAVAGGSTLLYQSFLNSGLTAPSPALIKAYLMNSAAYMSGTGAGGNLPSNSQGMGRMDLGRAFDGTARITVDQSQVLGATGATYTTSGTIPSSAVPFRVTLAWTDAPGPTTGAPFVNNLDLEVTVNGVLYRGNVFSGANSTINGTADTKNNAESVFLPAGTSGNFTITVRASNIAGDGVPGNADTTDQDFALIAYNATAGGSPNPIIGVNPSGFNFTGAAGGANPASQSLSIVNAGGGTLNWTASSNQPWLSIAPAAGTAPSTSNVSVNIAGLAAGSYSGAITITAAGAANSPLNVPVTLTVSPGGGGELIVNGGFEGSSTPWVFSGQAAWSTGAFPHTGAGYSLMGTTNSTSGAEFQTITIPTGAARNLNFWLNVTSDETTTTTQFDRFFVEVRNTSGTLLATLATFSNLNKGTAGVYVLRGPFNLGAFAGQTVRIQFRNTTDGSLITTFRVDDVSVQ